MSASFLFGCFVAKTESAAPRSHRKRSIQPCETTGRRTEFGGTKTSCFSKHTSLSSSPRKLAAGGVDGGSLSDDDVPLGDIWHVDELFIMICGVSLCAPSRPSWRQRVARPRQIREMQICGCHSRTPDPVREQAIAQSGVFALDTCSFPDRQRKSLAGENLVDSPPILSWSFVGRVGAMGVWLRPAGGSAVPSEHSDSDSRRPVFPACFRLWGEFRANSCLRPRGEGRRVVYKCYRGVTRV